MSEAESHVANAGLEFAKPTKDYDTPASASQVLYYRQVPPCLVLCSAGAQTMDFTCANEAASLSSEPYHWSQEQSSSIQRTEVLKSFNESDR